VRDAASELTFWTVLLAFHFMLDASADAWNEGHRGFVFVFVLGAAIFGGIAREGATS
jgi:hypothetical protein